MFMAEDHAVAVLVAVLYVAELAALVQHLLVLPQSPVSLHPFPASGHLCRRSE